MTKFEPVALRAVLGELPPGAQITDFTDWSRVSELLGNLAPEQRCDAVYAEWLHQLQSSSGPILLSVRNDLISHGALAANYLAELAQNADDASDGQPAEFRIKLLDDWLLVTNNGRKVTPKNLLGLCRFFVHFGREAAEAVQLDRETIGKFGIGFKSSYRIASEVFVETWDKAEQFAFRLPICHPDRPVSHPEPTRLAWIREHLRLAGSHISDETCQVKNLGLCTPEFTECLPDAVRGEAKKLQSQERGTAFCFHLHAAGQKEVAARMTGESGEIYELCPLFLPNLARVQRGEAELSRKLEAVAANDGVPGAVEARQVVLTTTVPGRRKANARFWRLRGLATGDRWQLALHSDSQFRLSVARVPDEEEGSSVKDGAAYAFFPLNDVNSQWPLRLHLHLDLPTILSRGNWNGAANSGAERDVVLDQIQRAIAGLAMWLKSQPGKRHDNWRIEDLVERVPERNELWARAVWDALLKESRRCEIIPDLNGTYVSVAGAVCIELLDRGEARNAWKGLPIWKPGQPVVEAHPTISLGLPKLSPDEVAEVLNGFAHGSHVSTAHKIQLLHASLACQRTSISMLERTLGRIPVELNSGGVSTLRELFEQPGGAELTPQWHEAFRQVAGWVVDAEWRYASIFGNRLETQLQKLAESRFNPTWSELPIRMVGEPPWREFGEAFWKSERRACPEGIQNGVFAGLRVPALKGTWLSLAEAWLESDTVPDCLKSVFQPIRSEWRGRIRDQLRQWQLHECWLEEAERRVARLLPEYFLNRLTDQADCDAVSLVFDQAFDSFQRERLGTLPGAVKEAAQTAIGRFIRARAEAETLNGKEVVAAEVSPTIRTALCLLPKRVPAPSWLSSSAMRRLGEWGIMLPFRMLGAKDVKQQQGQLCHNLLDRFTDWCDSEPSMEALAGLEEMAAVESLVNRRNWPVGLSPHKKPLLKDLVHAQPPDVSVSLIEQLKLSLLTKVERGNSELLPKLLAKVPSLAEACMQPHKLQLEIPALTLTPIERGQIPPAALEEPAVRTLVDAGGHGFFTTAQPIRLRWRQEDEVVATLPAADYIVDDNKLIFAHSLPPAGEEQFREVLALYQRSDNPSAEYQRDKEAGVSPFALYQSHRVRITKVLLEKEVQAMGYGREHVLRELLQNAESAYASKASPPSEPWFKFIVERPAQGGVCRVSISHIGRGFNELDKDGRERRDVERIVKVNAPIQNTEDEVGRFNRGFKSVFCVARDQRVRVRSGGYDFHVQDLLLRHPDPPVQKLGEQDPVTSFTFDAEFTDALAMLGCKDLPRANLPLPVLNASSLVFLRYLRRVTVKFESREWTWKISRQPEADGWERVTVDPCDNRVSEVFLVFRGRQEASAKRSFSAALRLNKEGLPTKLDDNWHALRLTFETNERFNLDVLVNGQFDAEQGRRKLVNVAECGLVDAALNAVVTLCESELRRENSKSRWLAWARVLNLGDGLRALQDRARSFEAISKRVEQFLTAHIPHGTVTKEIGQLVFPTGLMRELLKANYAGRWGIPTADWIDAEVERELPAIERAKFSLPKWLGAQAPLSSRLREIQTELSAGPFRTLTARFSQPQKDEFAEAQRVLAEKLRPVAPPAPVEAPPDPREKWSVSDLWHWWERHQQTARQDYTLDGANWPLFFSGDSRSAAERVTYLRSTLRAADTDAGRSLWYRVMSLACLMSAGRRMKELREFWKRDLEDRGFWQDTSGKAFGQGTDALFDELLRRRFADVTASGEDAHFWRRVFYDLRKIHRLVWGDGFPAVLLELAQSHERGPELLNFLRSGQLSGQRAWEGVFGQSAGVPLFFLVRELRRLRVVENRQLDPLSFFACAPVRRAAWQICWLDDDMVQRADFGSIAKVSELLHNEIAKDPVHGPKLLEDFDIPLLHYGLAQ